MTSKKSWPCRDAEIYPHSKSRECGERSTSPQNSSTIVKCPIKFSSCWSRSPRAAAIEAVHYHSRSHLHLHNDIRRQDRAHSGRSSVKSPKNGPISTGLPVPFQPQSPESYSTQSQHCQTIIRNANRYLESERICLRDGCIKHPLRTGIHQRGGHGLQEYGRQEGLRGDGR